MVRSSAGARHRVEPVSGGRAAAGGAARAGAADAGQARDAAGSQAARDALRFRLPGITTAVEMLSGGQRQGVAVARSAAFASRVVIMDEPTAALGVRETGQVLELIRSVRDRGLAIVLISHNMPNVFEVADRIHVMRLGRRVTLTSPWETTMAEIVAFMTGRWGTGDGW